MEESERRARSEDITEVPGASCRCQTHAFCFEIDTRKRLHVGTLHDPITYVKGALPPVYPALPQFLLELTNYFMHIVSPGSLWMLKPYIFIQKNMIKIVVWKKVTKP